MTNDSMFKRLVFVRYVDHVLYNRTSALAMQPQIRETVGWLVYECEQYVTLTWDHDADVPTLRGGDPKASGMVLLKPDVLELKMLNVCPWPLKENSECHINCASVITYREYALPAKKRKTPKEKGKTAI
jgi:hypothetical protein